MDTHTLSALLRSRTKTAQAWGLAIVTLMFLPDAFRVFGDESLSWAQKGEQITLALSRVALTVGAVAANPRDVIESPSKAEAEAEAEARSEGQDV